MTKLFTISALAALVSCRAPPRTAPTAEQTPHGSAPTAEPAPRGPALFGAGLFSTSAWDFFIAFSPGQTRALFGRADDAFERFAIFESRVDGQGRWSRPTRPRLASPWSDADPHISPDGRAVYFISNRPLDGGSDPRPIHDIFVAKLAADGEWGEAVRLPAPVNDGATDRWSPSVDRAGDLYFGAELPGTRGGSDLWVSHVVDGVYQPPVNLGDAINTSAHEVEPWISPDASYLIFAALHRNDGAGGYDLFLSQRSGSTWSVAEPLRAINTPANEWNHSVSPDGRWVYFTSTRAFHGALGERFDDPRDPRLIEGIGNGKGDIYRVSMDDIDPQRRMPGR